MWAASLLLPIEFHQTPLFPLKMDADDPPAAMCVLCARLALSSRAAGGLFLVLEQPRSSFCWGEPLPSTAPASPGLQEVGCAWMSPGALRDALVPSGWSGIPVNGCRGGDVGHICGDSPGCVSPGNTISGPLWGRGTGRSSWCCRKARNPSQCLITCIPLAHRREGGMAAPFPQLLAWVLPWKLLWRG